MLAFMKRYMGFFLLVIGVIGLIIMNVFDVSAEPKQNDKTTVTTYELTTTLSTNDFIFVDIKGEVKYPSVYQVSNGLRIDDIIKMAGGLTNKADISEINLAKTVYDQMVIYVPPKDDVTFNNLSESKVVVDIKGAVRYPGVYQVPSDYRLFDAIMRAGGTTSLADTSQINLSSLVADQMIISIPEKLISNSSDSSSSLIYVVVTGEVVKTGLYPVDSNLLIKDVINIAGGVKSTADLSNINLSQGIVNQMVIHIPSKEETSSQSSSDDINSPANSQKININQATIDQLDTLPGIGYIIAQRIIDYRAEFGLFESIEDIMNVSGIKETVYAKIKDLIRV